MAAVILRRRGLGLSTLRKICRHSTTGLSFIRNDRLDRLPPNTDMVIRWGCTSRVPVRNVLNNTEAIHRVNEKAEFRRTLNEHSLCPRTWFNVLDPDLPREGMFVVRPRNHHRGNNFFVCNRDEVNEAAYMCDAAHGGYYISDLIEKRAEYRVFVAQGRVVWVAQKVPRNPEHHVWNHHSGNCVFENVRWGAWPLQGARKAVEAFNLSGLDFGGVDVIQGHDGTCYVLEINSASSQDSEYRNSLIARVFDYIITHGKEHFPLIQDRGGWRKFIHPAISTEAQLVTE